MLLNVINAGFVMARNIYIYIYIYRKRNTQSREILMWKIAMKSYIRGMIQNNLEFVHATS